MIARVRLDLALRKEFDYLVPSEFAGQVGVGIGRPFGPRQVMGSVIDVVETSPHTNLRPIAKVLGRQALITPEILRLARWIAEYYCCRLEVALKSVLPEAVRKEEEGWRERLSVRALPAAGELPKSTKRQQEVWTIVEEWGELPLQELLKLAETTAETVRRLEDKHLIVISNQISERDPYAREHILPNQPLPLNPEQASALAKIKTAMERAASVSLAEIKERTAIESAKTSRGIPLNSRAAPPAGKMPAARRPLPLPASRMLAPRSLRRSLIGMHPWPNTRAGCRTGGSGINCIL